MNLNDGSQHSECVPVGERRGIAEGGATVPPKESGSSLQVFERRESAVRSYCRSFPTVFISSRAHEITDDRGRVYIDFFSGAGALNYGHNNPRCKERLLEYIQADGIAHGLDMATGAKAEFLERFESTILMPRGMEYRVQFPGPTGTNAVEAALKLARKIKGRPSILSFTNGYHGMTLGALAVTGNSFARRGAGVPLGHASVAPFEGYLGPETDTIAYLDKLLGDPSSGVELPAAIIVETVQAEGGVRVASFSWLQRLAALARRRDVLLIVDDIQVGCGRTGPFFSFEEAGISPDIICLSKSISGNGLPMALVLIREELDRWAPGEHNGTFRGNNLAFVTASAALSYWETNQLSLAVAAKGQIVRERLASIASCHAELKFEVRGRGLIAGLVCPEPRLAREISRIGFELGLIVETSGPKGEVVKLLPPLTIEIQALEAGLELLGRAVELAVGAPRNE